MTSLAPSAIFVSVRKKASARGTSSIPAPLARAIEEAKGIELDASKTEMEKRYALGALAKKIRDGSTYGNKPLERLADAIGRDRSTIFRAVTIATYWTRAEVSALSSRKGRNGLGIRWSHLELVAAKTNATEREGLIDRVLKEGLTVRGLKRVANPRKKVVKVDQATADVASLNEMVAEIYPLTTSLRERTKQVQRVVNAAIPSTRRSLTELRGGLLSLATVINEIVSLLPPDDAHGRDGSAGRARQKSGRPDKSERSQIQHGRD